MLPLLVVLGNLVILLGELPGFYSFNLDVDHSPVKMGPKNSFFGLSVTGQRLLHQERHSSMLLVGAPLSTRVGGVLNATGDLYQCPLTMKSDDCHRVPIDDNLNPQEKQWLGVSVDSQGVGGLVVTCAHRWEDRRNVGAYNMEQHNQLGRCFLMNQDLKMPHSNYFTRTSTMCMNRGSSHTEYGMCQQGIAAGFVRGTDLLYYGAPGALTWKGMVWVRKIDQNSEDFEDEMETDDKKNRNVTLNSYMGFSVTGSYGLTQKNQYSMVAGIPRIKHTGAVVLLEPHVKHLVEKIMLTGFQIASGFGYSVAVADFNADMWVDLVVGAPNYLEKSGEVGGAVYVFTNNGGSFDQNKYVRLLGKTNSMFGLAVAPLGDQDLDGFEDLAVGAPFDANGKVYIFRGGPDGIIQKPAQVIGGEDFSHPIQQFGFAISAGKDLDDNNYPDIVVGSLSDKVTLLRGRPVVSIIKSVNAQPGIIDADSKNNPITFIVQPCASYIPKDPKYNQQLLLQYNLQVDAERWQQGLVQRVDSSFKNGRIKLPGPSINVCQSITFTLKANISDKLSPIVFDFKFKLVERKVKRQKNQAERLPSLDAFPVWNSSDHSSRILVHILKKDCKNNICYSNLQLESLFWPWEENHRGKKPLPRNEQDNQWLLLRKQKMLALQVNVTNLPSHPAYPDKDGHAAHEAKLTVTLPPTLGYKGFRSTERDITCKPVNNMTTSCTLGNPFKKGQKSELHLLFDATHITTGTSDLEIELLLTTMSVQPGIVPIKVHLDIQTEISFTVNGVPEPRELSFGGVVMGESAMKVEEDVGSPLSILFTVFNFGRLLPSDATSLLSLHIAWPFETSSGKWLLYLMNADSMVGNLNHTCEVSDGEINPLKLQETPRKSRRRRNAEVSSAKYGLERTSKHRQEQFDCGSRKTSRCQDVVCTLPNITERAYVHLSARLWNSTLLEDYGDYDKLEIFMEAYIQYENKMKNIVVASKKALVVVTVYSDVVMIAPEKIDFWVIAVSVTAGILFLALITFLLWKCGFFKRTTMDKRYVTPLHTAQVHTQPSEMEKISPEDTC